jgi:hypothetical protein
MDMEKFPEDNLPAKFKEPEPLERGLGLLARIISRDFIQRQHLCCGKDANEDGDTEGLSNK